MGWGQLPFPCTTNSPLPRRGAPSGHCLYFEKGGGGRENVVPLSRTFLGSANKQEASYTQVKQSCAKLSGGAECLQSEQWFVQTRGWQHWGGGVLEAQMRKSSSLFHWFILKNCSHATLLKLPVRAAREGEQGWHSKP